VLWSQLLDIRTDLTGLQQTAPELAAEILACRAILDSPATTHVSEADLGSVAARHQRAAEARMRAGRRFEQLVAQVRALAPTPAFPHPQAFLAAPTIGTLLPDRHDTPVVLVNISRWRCDALVLTTAGVTVKGLAGLTEAQVIEEANRYLIALSDFETSRRSAADRFMLELAITSTLEWLWDNIAGPILDHLGYTGTPSGTRPRLWWCPTGALTVLPVHAAGYHTSRRDTVHDRVVSSYIPTLRAFNRARHLPASSRPSRILVITLPNTPGRPRLPGASIEQNLLCTHFDAAHRTVLPDATATRNEVLSQLGRHRWLHAACHGEQDHRSPSSGGLVPYNWTTAGRVTITDLTNVAHGGGEFAFLSACKTAAGGVSNPDEVINVAAAMQYIGWRHVIGALWSVWDDAATMVAERVYAILSADNGLDSSQSAAALHIAVRELRNRRPDYSSSWVPFIHTGP
jgi:hypothetical protein